MPAATGGTNRSRFRFVAPGAVNWRVPPNRVRVRLRKRESAEPGFQSPALRAKGAATIAFWNSNIMTDQDRLEELLNRWEDLRDQKQEVSAEGLCRDWPELLPEFRRRVAELDQIDGFLSGGLLGPEAEDELTAAGRYRPLQLHAYGGLGEVFTARDEELGRDVALKRMRSLAADNPQWIRHFKFEAEITGRLDHPGVVPVYGLGRDASGRLYYAMRFIRGETLAQAAERFHRDFPAGSQRRDRAVAFQKLIRSFLVVCQTMGYAHSQGVIHRDLKPANIMLGHYGETLVVDWGLAKRLPQRGETESGAADVAQAAGATVADQTMLGQVKGSPAYMSPEQAEGRIHQIGPRSDIYSLGATLYTILAGKPPFSDMGLYELIDHVKRGDWPHPSQIRGDVAPALEAICVKAMRLNPDERYATALELAADLEHWLADDAVSAWREPWTSRAKRWMRKHQTLTSTVVAAALVAMLGISAVALQQRQSNRALGEKNTQLAAANQQATSEAQRALHSEQKAVGELYSFLILSADRALEAGDRRFAEEALDQCPQDLRNIEWRLLYRRTMGSRQTWRLDRASLPSIALSDDGTRIAIADLNGPVRVLNRADGKLAVEFAGPARTVAFLPDGDHLLVHAVGHPPAAPGPAELWSIQQKKQVVRFAADVDRVVLSGDGKRVALISVAWPGPLVPGTEVSSRIHICDAISGKLIALTDRIPGRVADAAFSPDHERLYAIVRQIDAKPGLGFAAAFLQGDSQSNRFEIQAWNVADAREPSLLKPVLVKDGPPRSDPVAMAIAPDGKQILVSDKNPQPVPAGPGASRLTLGRIIILDAATGETVKADGYDLGSPDRPLDLESALGSLAVSPDGKRLAVAIGNRILVLDRESGKRLAELSGHVAPVQCAVFDRDGSDLFTAGGDDGRIKRWTMALPSTDRIAVASGQASQGHGVAFSSDGRRMAVAAADGGIEIYSVANARPEMMVPPIASAVPQVQLGEANRLFPLVENAKYVDGHRASDIRFAPDGKRLTAIYYDRLICVWDTSGAKPAVVDFLDMMALDKDQGVHPFAHPLLLSPDGKYLASDSRHFSTTRKFHVWEIGHRRLVVSHEKDTGIGAEPKMAFARDSRTFVLDRNSPNANRAVLAWDLASGKPAEVPDVTHRVDPVDPISPDGSRRLRIVDGGIKIEDRQTGRTVLEYRGYVWAIFSPDGHYILACKRDGAALLDASPFAQLSETR